MVDKIGQGEAYLRQTGPTYGAKIIINGATNIPQPASVKYEPPEPVGKSIRGKPFYQGLPSLILGWKAIDIDGFQALSVEFFPILNSIDGPIVNLIWPSPYEAGRFIEAKAYMEWPKWGDWSESWIRDVEVRFSSFSLQGQGLYNDAVIF